MSQSELLLSVFPLLLMFVFAVVVLWKSGIFHQREHRKRVEALLERIAIAVESRSKAQ